MRRSTVNETHPPKKLWVINVNFLSDNTYRENQLQCPYPNDI